MKRISIEKLKENTESIYESIIIMSKRARQVTDEQKHQIDNEMNIPNQIDSRDSEEFGEVEIDRDALYREHKTYPKPSTVVMIEMAEGNLCFEYLSPEEEAPKDK